MMIYGLQTSATCQKSPAKRLEAMELLSLFRDVRADPLKRGKNLSS